MFVYLASSEPSSAVMRKAETAGLGSPDMILGTPSAKVIPVL